MISLKRYYPFNTEQTVNILSEFGPLVTMFIVNAAFNIEAGTWSLIAATIVAIVAMRLVLQRLPVFPLIASSVTILFGALTIITNDPMWVQMKVTIFNAMFAGFLFGGLALHERIVERLGELAPVAVTVALTWLFGLVPGAAGMIAVIVAMWATTKHRPSDLNFAGLAATLTFAAFVLIRDQDVLPSTLITLGALAVGFVLGGFLNKNFFQYTFEKTFHYTEEGWHKFTRSFAWFFVFTAVLNELIRLTYVDTQVYDVFGYEITGINIWILFKVAFIMPLSGIYAWYLTRLMREHRIPDGEPARAPKAPGRRAGKEKAGIGVHAKIAERREL